MKKPEPIRLPNWAEDIGPEENARREAYLRDNVQPDVALAMRQTAFLRTMVDAEHEDVVLMLQVRCSGRYRNEMCGKLAARVWGSPGSEVHYIRGTIRTFPEGRTHILGVAMAEGAAGLPSVAAATSELADVDGIEYDGVLQKPTHPEGTWLFGCPRHGNEAVHFSDLEREALSSRKTFQVEFGRPARPE